MPENTATKAELRWCALTLALPLAPLAPETTCAAVYDMMAADATLVALAVTTGDVPLGLVDRAALMSDFARPYWRDVFARRSIIKLMDARPLIVDALLPIEAIGLQIATEKHAALNSGFVVMRGGRYFGVGHSVQLLKLVADQARERARELEAAHAEIRAFNDDLERRVEERTAELREAQQELMRKERLSTLGKLTATVAHELRNPLSAIRNTLFTLRETTVTAGLNLERPIERMDRSVTRCDRIIGDLLNYTRQRPLTPASLNADRWLGEVLDEQVLPPGIGLVRRLGAPDCVLRFDADRMRRVVINLVENAAQALDGMPDPGRDKRITITTAAAPSGYRLAIEDTGPGIVRDLLPKVFEPLFSTKSFGTGLGLPTVKQIVEQHGGAIAMASEPGQGTRVVVDIPFAAAQEDAA